MLTIPVLTDEGLQTLEGVMRRELSEWAFLRQVRLVQTETGQIAMRGPTWFGSLMVAVRGDVQRVLADELGVIL